MGAVWPSVGIVALSAVLAQPLPKPGSTLHDRPREHGGAREGEDREGGPKALAEGRGCEGGRVVKSTVCPKCGRPAWAPYLMTVTGKYGQAYEYEVYRHPDGRRRTPRKHTVRVSASEGVAE